MHSDSHRIDYRKRIDKDNPVNAIYQLKGENFCARTIRTPEGVYITVRNNDIIPIIDIVAPYKVGAEKALEYRGLLRALQDEDDPCEPLEEPTGEPGDEDYDAGKFSELHPLYNPEDSDQQWLVYPDSLSIEHNPFKNYPLPPLGGTFIMDMLGAPFNPRAFSINGKPNLFSCKMLLTGGGSREGDGEFQFGEVIEGIRVRELEPRVFRVGRMNEMNGWPWADKRDPEQSFLRLVSLSAKLEHISGAIGQNYNKAIFTLEFLKPNNTECVQADEDELDSGYVCLDPVEFEVELDDALYDYAVHPFGNTEWVDFSILSLMPDGSKAVIGLHQRGEAGLLGQYYDFVILDLAKIIDDPLDFDFYSRFDTWTGWTERSVSSDGQLTDMAHVYEDPTPIDIKDSADPPENKLSSLTENYTVGNQILVELVDEFDEVIYPTERVEDKDYDFSACIYLHFGENGVLYETYARVTQLQKTTETQTSTSITGVISPPLVGRRYVRVKYWAIGGEYKRGSVVSTQQLFSGINWNNVYITLEDHTATNDNRPGLEWNGTEYVDRTGSIWKMVRGNRFDGVPGCTWATWNGVNACDPNVSGDCDTLDELSAHGTSDGWNILVLGEGGSRLGVWAVPTGISQGTLYEHEMGLETVINTTTYSDIYQRRLDLEAENIWAGRSDVVDSMVLEVTNLSAHTTKTNTSTRNDLRCLWQLDTIGYPINRGVAQATNQSHTLMDSASENTLVHAGPNYSVPAYPTARTLSGAWPINGLIGPIFEAHDTTATTFKAEVFRGRGLDNLRLFPASGGWAVAIGARSVSSTSTTPTTTGNTTASGAQRSKCVVTVGSKWAFTEVDDTNPWESFSIIAPLRPDLEEMPAFTDPLPLVNMQAEEEEEAEALLKPVRGPEKSITCLKQQISYVGWLYPQELTEAEE